jgi:hypothetical protein
MIDYDENDLSNGIERQGNHPHPCPDFDDQLGRSCSCRTGSGVDQARKGDVLQTSDPTSLESATLVNDLVDGFGDGWIRWSYRESTSNASLMIDQFIFCSTLLPRALRDRQ